MLDTIVIRTADLYEGIRRTPIISDVLEFFHMVTRQRAIRQEIFLTAGDTVRQQDLDQLEENLRLLGIFAEIDVSAQLEEGAEDSDVRHGRVLVRTRDAVSLRGGASYTQSEDSRDFFLGLKEYNLFGLAKQFGLSLTYTTLNDLGLTYSASYLNPNLFGTHMEFGADLGISADRRSGAFNIGRTFFSDRTPIAFNTYASFFNGDHVYDFRTPTGAVSSTDDVHQVALGGWVSNARYDAGNMFTTSLAVTYNRTDHNRLTDLHRAFENTAGVFVGIGSRKRTYTKIVNADFHGEQQVPIGGMGSVTIGKISPVHGGLDNVVYIGADARKAWRSGNVYAFASIEVGTGLAGTPAEGKNPAGTESRFTTERVVASGVLLTEPGALVARFEQSTVWNWPRYLFLPLDNISYLRGYPRLENFGDNRMVLNVEYRLTPIFRFIVFDIGAAAFYDVGAAWRQSEKLHQAQFQSGAGLGLRFSNADATIAKGIFRVDFAYNFHDSRFSRIIIGVTEAFDVFGSFDYRPPGAYTY